MKYRLFTWLLLGLLMVTLLSCKDDDGFDFGISCRLNAPLPSIVELEITNLRIAPYHVLDTLRFIDDIGVEIEFVKYLEDPSDTLMTHQRLGQNYGFTLSFDSPFNEDLVHGFRNGIFGMNICGRNFARII